MVENSVEQTVVKKVLKTKRVARFCRICGKTKHNICFDHHGIPKQYINRRIRDVVPMRLKYYRNKISSMLTKILGFSV